MARKASLTNSTTSSNVTISEDIVTRIIKDGVSVQGKLILWIPLRNGEKKRIDAPGLISDVRKQVRYELSLAARA